MGPMLIAPETNFRVVRPTTWHTHNFPSTRAGPDRSADPKRCPAYSAPSPTRHPGPTRTAPRGAGLPSPLAWSAWRRQGSPAGRAGPRRGERPFGRAASSGRETLLKRSSPAQSQFWLQEPRAGVPHRGRSARFRGNRRAAPFSLPRVTAEGAGGSDENPGPQWGGAGAVVRRGCGQVRRRADSWPAWQVVPARSGGHRAVRPPRCPAGPALVPAGSRPGRTCRPLRPRPGSGRAARC
jgi:hypothetical protein